MRRSVIAAVGTALAFQADPVGAVDKAVDLFPVLLDGLTAPLGLPPGPTPPELLQVQRAIRVPFIRGPESASHSFAFRFDPSLGGL